MINEPDSEHTQPRTLIVARMYKSLGYPKEIHQHRGMGTDSHDVFRQRSDAMKQIDDRETFYAMQSNELQSIRSGQESTLIT